jgi:hypothetical protein
LLIASGVVFGIVAVVLIAVLVPISIVTVGYDEYGVEYHDIEKRISQDVLSEGSYTKPPGT